MDKDEWGDPEIFRPERFLDECGLKVVGRDRILPFSIGLLYQLNYVAFDSIECYQAIVGLNIFDITQKGK